MTKAFTRCTAPYMHDGSLKTLKDVIEFYDRGGNPNPNLDPEIKPLRFTAEEKAALLAFLKALSGEIQEGMGAQSERHTSEAESTGGPLEGRKKPVGRQ